METMCLQQIRAEGFESVGFSLNDTWLDEIDVARITEIDSIWYFSDGRIDTSIENLVRVLALDAFIQQRSEGELSQSDAMWVNEYLASAYGIISPAAVEIAILIYERYQDQIESVYHMQEFLNEQRFKSSEQPRERERECEDLEARMRRIDYEHLLKDGLTHAEADEVMKLKERVIELRDRAYAYQHYRRDDPDRVTVYKAYWGARLSESYARWYKTEKPMAFRPDVWLRGHTGMCDADVRWLRKIKPELFIADGDNRYAEAAKVVRDQTGYKHLYKRYVDFKGLCNWLEWSPDSVRQNMGWEPEENWIA